MERPPGHCAPSERLSQLTRDAEKTYGKISAGRNLAMNTQPTFRNNLLVTFLEFAFCCEERMVHCRRLPLEGGQEATEGLKKLEQ